MASYDISYQPNFVMFVNFVFDNYDGQKSFERYVKSSCDSFVGERVIDEGFSEKEKPYEKYFLVFSDQWKTWLYSLYRRMYLSFYTKGKTIKVKV